tara:strand:- start:382 stop:786 length:405 start_codon:yes stop_codon:yes gene_type:complete
MERDFIYKESTVARILVIDDSQSIRAKMRYFLEEGTDHEVLEATDGANALDILKEDSRFDLIICDVNMPIMDGIAFAHSLSEDDNLRIIPFVFCTTESAASLKKEIKGLGIEARYIMKPVTQKTLMVTLEKVLK